MEGARVVLEDANLILPGLYLGSYKATEDRVKLKQQGVTHILIAAANILPLFPTEFSYLVLHEVLDTEEQDIMSHFGDCLSFIHEARAQGGSVLVVCMVGMSRSASVVIAYVMDEMRLCAEDAYCLVKRARSKVCPNPSFAQQLRLFHIMRDTFLDKRRNEVKDDTEKEDNEEEEEESEESMRRLEVQSKAGEDDPAHRGRCPHREVDENDHQQHGSEVETEDANVALQRSRAERDYVMVRHISHMYHSAHKLSREGRIPAECFAKDPSLMSREVRLAAERTYGCVQCNRRLFTELNVLPHKKKRPTIACNVVFIQPLEWMIAQRDNRKPDEEIPGIGDDQEGVRKAAKGQRVRYVSSFHAKRDGGHLEFVTKDGLGGLQKVFGELRCPSCDCKVGYWNWMGNGCYCGQRMMPAFCIERKCMTTIVEDDDGDVVKKENNSSTPTTDGSSRQPMEDRNEQDQQPHHDEVQRVSGAEEIIKQ